VCVCVCVCVCLCVFVCLCVSCDCVFASARLVYIGGVCADDFLSGVCAKAFEAQYLVLFCFFLSGEKPLTPHNPSPLTTPNSPNPPLLMFHLGAVSAEILLRIWNETALRT
jgi:hypothetical protein